jgi:hypothetical protein
MTEISEDHFMSNLFRIFCRPLRALFPSKYRLISAEERF